MSKIMSKAYGEHIVCAELARRGILATPFAGNVPDFDIVYVKNGISREIQVKATKTTWPDNIEKYATVTFSGKKQKIGPAKKRNNPHRIWIFVQIRSDGSKDRFFILKEVEYQKMVIKNYRYWLRSKGQIRPKKWTSIRIATVVSDLEKYENNWEIL